MAHKKGGGSTRNGRDSNARIRIRIRQGWACPFAALRVGLRAR
jgi:hypothetical protein